MAAAATSDTFLFYNLLFCDDSLERVPAVAVVGATKEFKKKNLSPVLPGLTVLILTVC